MIHLFPGWLPSSNKLARPALCFCFFRSEVRGLFKQKGMCVCVSEVFFYQSGNAMIDGAAMQLDQMYTHYAAAYVSLVF